MLKRGFQLAGLVTTVLVLANPSVAQFESVDPTKDAFDSVMLNYRDIDWDDPLNPRYVNLDNDQLLVDTRGGVFIWDIASNTLDRPMFSDAISNPEINKLSFGTANWARLGNSPQGTVLVSVGDDHIGHTLLWWDGKSKKFAAALPIDRALGVPRLLALDPVHVLLCGGIKGSRVVRVKQSSDQTRLDWVAANDPQAEAAMRTTAIVGPVLGFGKLSASDSDRPVFYETSHCGWEIANPPEDIRKDIDPKARKYAPRIKPYFLADGRVLVSEADFYNGQSWQELNPPLLWQPEKRRWVSIERTYGHGSRIHRIGQQEPVFAHSSGSPIIEFLDTHTMRWIRSRQRLPETNDVNIEPLSNGNAVVLMRKLRNSPNSNTGLVAPMRSPISEGHLGFTRYRYDGEIALGGGSLMLVGDGRVWEPSTRNEIIDTRNGQSRSIASLPTPLISPYGLKLKDGSVVVFGGLPAGCDQDSIFFESGPCRHLPSQPSFRYLSDQDRWQRLPELRIPFTLGYWWQTGNSDLTSQWARSDAAVRSNGDVAWIEGGEFFGSGEKKGLLPQSSQLRCWRPATGKASPETNVALNKARRQATLLELGDGRLALMGGWAQLERVALEKDCLDCPDEFVSIGPFRPARSTEILDESEVGHPVWKAGPVANYDGGRALRLANGRIFKLSLTGVFDEYGYRAEIADTAFTRWERLPPFPLSPAVVRNVSVASNRIIILTDKDQTVVWDDTAGSWQIWSQWPPRAGTKDDPPISVNALDDGQRVLVRYSETFELLPLPAR